MTDLLDVPRSAFAAVLGAGTALRGARVFHPHGTTHTCRVVADGLDPDARWGADLLDRAAEHEGVVRISRGAGLPRPLPDVEGLALRLPGLGVDGGPLDLLVNSAWRYAFVPSAVSRTWSAVLPHRTGAGRLVLVGARPRPGGFTLLASAPPVGRWLPWGRIELGEVRDGERLRFRPTLGAPDLVPVALFRALRGRSYGVSQDLRE